MAAVKSLLADFDAAKTVDEKRLYLKVIHGLCESTGFTISEFAVYDVGSFEDAVQRVAWLVYEADMALSLTETVSKRAGQLLAGGVRPHQPKTEPEETCPVCGVPSPGNRECERCLSYGGDF